jgi:hypothetical protein
MRSGRQMALREMRIIERLAAGMSIGEIALQESLSPRRVRELIAKSLAERGRLPAPEFFELQVRRLNEALLVAYTAMSAQNLGAVDRVVKIVRELDRYHGFVPAAPALGAAAPPLALAAPPLSLAPASEAGALVDLGSLAEKPRSAEAALAGAELPMT